MIIMYAYIQMCIETECACEGEERKKPDYNILHINSLFSQCISFHHFNYCVASSQSLSALRFLNQNIHMYMHVYTIIESGFCFRVCFL